MNNSNNMVVWIVLCFVLGVFRCALYVFNKIHQRNGVLATCLSRHVIDLTYWRLGHFLLHFVCGLLFPDCFTVFFALGCTWEVYEVVMGLCTKKMAHWAPRFPLENLADVVCNVIGFMCGSYVAQIEEYQSKTRVGWPS